MPDQDDIWSGTEFSAGKAPAASTPNAPIQTAPAEGNDIWAGTEFGTAKTESSTAQPQPQAADPRFQPNRPDAAPMELSEVGTQALQNLPRSAKEFGHAIVQPFLHPLDTAEALGKVGTGIYSKAKGALGVEQEAGTKAKDEASVDALVDFYKQRYGTWENAKRAIAEDPVGVLADASTIFTGGGGLAARLPGAAGKIGEVAGTVGRVTDPLNIALQAPKAAAKAITSTVNIPAAIQSGAAYKSLQAAHEAGVTKNPSFWEHFSGKADGSQLVGKVESGVDQIRKERSDNFIAGLKGEEKANAAKVLPYTLVDDALSKARARAYNLDKNGNIISSKSDTLHNAYVAMEQEINAFKNGNIDHNIASFHDLKRTLRNKGRAAAGRDSDALGMADEVANSAKQTIIDPKYGASEKYANTMEKYGEASDKLNEIKANLLSGKSDSTKLNKLLKSYKNDMNVDLLSELYKKDPTLASSIAGHDLANWLPGGLRGNIVSSIIYGGSGFINPAFLLHPAHALHFAASNALSSPKLMGGFNYATGRASALPSDIYKVAPYAPAVSQVGEGMDVLERTKRASGGRISHDSKADALVRSAEMAKKDISKGTEALLDQPDETITRALAVAKKHI
jgi:hypothetical protein